MKKNMSRFLEIIIFTGLIIMITYLFASGKVTMYLHPKMNKYLLFALFALIAVNAVWIYNYTKSNGVGQALKVSYLLFLIPIIFGGINTNEINGAVLRNRTVDLNQSTANAVEVISEEGMGDYLVDKQSTAGELVAIEQVVVVDDPTEAIPIPASEVASLTAEEIENDGDEIEIEASETEETEQADSVIEEVVVVEEVQLKTASFKAEDDFYTVITELHVNTEANLGAEVTLEGFVFREEGFNQNTFVISRLVMSCCAADAYVTGLYVKDEVAKGIDNDSWVRVTGILSEDAIYNPSTDRYYMNPVLSEVSIEVIEAYDNPYVYPQ